MMTQHNKHKLYIHFIEKECFLRTQMTEWTAVDKLLFLHRW